jgi:diguanylate cyclase (GGDEF)-like protein
MGWCWTVGRRLAFPATDNTGGAHELARWLHRALVAALVVYSATTLPGVRSSHGYNVLIDGWLQNIILVAACLLIFVRVRSVRTDRLAWALIGVGLSLYAVGTILYCAYVQYLDTVPTPSAADVPWLLSYAFLYAGLVSLVRGRVVVSNRTLWLDGAIAALGVSAVASIWLHALLRTTSSSFVPAAMTMAYPVGDLVLLMIIVAACGLLGCRPDRALSYLGIGLVLFAAADTVYTFRVATNNLQSGTMVDPMWAVAAVLIAAAALRPLADHVAAHGYRWASLVIPTVFTLSSLGVLVYESTHRLPALTTALATAALLAGVARAAMSFHEVRQLVVNRTEARTDALTGLGNRRHFQEITSQSIARLEPDQRLAVLVIDLDRFKEVNDSHGHSVGDLVLVQAGERLSGYLRREDAVVRLGGDEYAVVLVDVCTDEALNVANRMRLGLQEAFAIDGLVISIDASIGIALCPDVATTVGGLLRRADMAMYEAKVNRIGCLVYETGDDDPSARLQLILELRSAISDCQLVLHYQPKVDLRTAKITGVEALVRWHHPDRGLLFPDTFIPVAERYGLMRNLTTAVLALALDQVHEWRAAGFPTPVAVNVSASDVVDAEFPDQVKSMLDVRGLDGTALVIEITETTLMHDNSRALSVLRGLRALGVRVSIDDYGTGYSSLARLRDLPIDELKLDRSFIAALRSDSRSAAIVESTIHLARALGLTLVAEGIETAETLQMLTAMHCDVGQGYYLCRPIPAADLTPLLAASKDAGSPDGEGLRVASRGVTRS